MLHLTVAVEMDRTGHVYGYNEHVSPDQYVMSSGTNVGTDRDPVLQAAVEWLNTQIDTVR
jgi:hypothetical protein